jgi:hypothetical protein
MTHIRAEARRRYSPAMVSARFVAPLLLMLAACQGAAELPENGDRRTGPTVARATPDCDRSTVVEVSGRANIFGAGISHPPPRRVGVVVLHPFASFCGRGPRRS